MSSGCPADRRGREVKGRGRGEKERRRWFHLSYAQVEAGGGKKKLGRRRLTLMGDDAEQANILLEQKKEPKKKEERGARHVTPIYSSGFAGESTTKKEEDRAQPDAAISSSLPRRPTD